MTDLLDTGPLDAEAPPEESARRTLNGRDVWRKAKLPALVGLALVLVAVLRAIAAGPVSNTYLDPTATGNLGALAIVELLRDHGVEVREVDAPSSSRDVTVFFPVPGRADPEDVAAATAAADLVLVDPPPPYATAAGAGVGVAGSTDVDVVEPGCEQPDAVAAGPVRLGGTTFSADLDAVVCYASRGEASFVEVTNDGQRTTFLGSGFLFTNEHLDDDGNAALALRLLSRHPTVEWVFPRALATVEEEESLVDLLPHRIFVLLAELAVVVGALVLWRVRRLGPVVVEPLPVVVRAAEAVEGRARLYQSARARGRAAEALRAGLRDRLVRTLGLASDASRSTLVAAVTPRTRGRTAQDVDDLLYGPPPTDDPSLVRIANDLDRLYNEVRDL